MPNDSSIAVRNSTQRRNKVHIGYNGTPQIHPPNCPFPFDDHHQNLIHRFRARPDSLPKTASRSIHVCGHNSHLWTDRRKWRDECMQRRANNNQHMSLLTPVIPRSSGWNYTARKLMAAQMLQKEYIKPVAAHTHTHTHACTDTDRRARRQVSNMSAPLAMLIRNNTDTLIIQNLVSPCRCSFWSAKIV